MVSIVLQRHTMVPQTFGPGSREFVARVALASPYTALISHNGIILLRLKFNTYRSGPVYPVMLMQVLKIIKPMYISIFTPDREQDAHPANANFAIYGALFGPHFLHQHEDLRSYRATAFIYNSTSLSKHELFLHIKPKCSYSYKCGSCILAILSIWSQCFSFRIHHRCIYFSINHHR